MPLIGRKIRRFPGRISDRRDEVDKKIIREREQGIRWITGKREMLVEISQLIW
ncbi:MAG: hypothetical protein NTZ39_05755 [Methanoregula sp.]|nr:hypothetical protein [Methanoregula sp.]